MSNPFDCAFVINSAWRTPLEAHRMAQVKSRKYPPIECDDIHFLYRPAVGVDEAHGFKDVRHLYILLKPWDPRIYRPIIAAAKVALPRRSASSSMPSSTRWAISALPIWRMPVTPERVWRATRRQV
jgi:hypothetical protein